MKNTSLICLAIVTMATAFLLSSCSTPKPLEYRDFKNLSIEKMGFTNSSVSMDIVYYNPNRYGLQLNRTDLDIYINNIFLGHTSQQYFITIPRSDTFSIPLRLEVDMRNLFKNGLNLLLKNEVLVRVSGTLKVGKANVFMIFPVRYEGMEAFTIF